MRFDVVEVEQIVDVRVVQLFHFLNFRGGAEAVEEVNKGKARIEGGHVGDERVVHALLHVIAGQHSPTGLAHAHDVAVVAEDGQSVSGQSSRGNMEDRGGQLTGDLVHIRNHEQETLRGREGARQRAGLQGSVHSAAGAAFGLHFHDAGHRAPDILCAARAPSIR